MLERIAPRKNERDAIEAFYVKNRNAMPLWFANGQLSERTRDAVAHLRGIDADGLDPSDYSTPDAASSVDAAAEAELRFTATMLTYARHAMSGRVHFSRVSPNIDYKDNFDPADAMAKIASSTDLRRTLDGFNPQHPGYKALKAKYAEMRNQTAEPAGTRIPQGPVLKYGRDKNGRETFMLDPRVPQLRERLGLPAAPDNRYDRALVEAVAKFQKANGITANGQLTAATIDALNGPSREQQMDAILATMERWRWMPRNLGATHVALNIPDFHLRVMNNGAAGLEDPRRGRQADAGDAADHRDDEVHHRQSDLERAAVDHLQRAAAALRSRPIRTSSPAWVSRWSASRTARSACSSRRASAMRWAASASISRTSSWSTSTTRRRSTTSRTTSAPTATAACGCRIR